MGKRTRRRNPRNFGFQKEMRRRPSRPELRSFRFVAREGDSLGEEAIRVLFERGFDAVVYSGAPPHDNDIVCVFLMTSTVQQRTTTRLAVHGYSWQSWKRGPFVILLRRRRTRDFATAILVAAERYVSWGSGLARGQLAPFPVRYTLLTDERRGQFETWRRAVGEEVGIPVRETNYLIEGLRAAASCTVAVVTRKNHLIPKTAS